MIGKIQTVISDPQFAFRVAARRLNRRYHNVSRKDELYSRGCDVLAEDWDNLVILDACRYDVFERCSDIPGRLEHRRARGTMTLEFLESNFADRQATDAVYVTANPMFYRHANRLNTSFHSVINVWQDSGWDRDTNTVLPETTTEYAEQAAEQFPDKRLIVHYIQPHFPFINAEAELRARSPDPAAEGKDLWSEIMFDRIDVSDAAVWKLYADNLKTTLPHVEDLLENLIGKTVITSDHGNMIGERSFPIPIKEYGHPAGIYSEELTKVPWLIHKSGERKTITDEINGSETEAVGQKKAKERLRQLGYLPDGEGV